MRLSVSLCLLAACSQDPLQDGEEFGRFTQVKSFFTSAMVAETSEGVVVIDTGFSKTAAPVERFLEGRGLGLGDVSHVLITHGHSDHVRGLLAFENATVWAHEDEVDHVLEEAEEGARVDETFVDGQVLALGDLAVEVFHVPGHTPGNVVFLAEGVLLTGDTAMSYKDGTVGPAPERYADDPSLAQTNLLALRDRLEARNEPLESVAFAHSRGLQDPSAFWAMTASD